MDLSFFDGRSILVSGHTGFKGSWLCKVLINAGAKLTGYALEPETEPSLFKLCGISERMNSVIGDIRNYEVLLNVFHQVQPEIVFHLAAQPIVRESFAHPRYTFETNVMGTINVLECIRQTNSVKSFLNVTTDKVYLNREWPWGYREDEPLNGFDPYSNSKSCADLATQSYQKSFFSDREISVSIARAGNVIGGGDFARDRIIPDCLRAALNSDKIIVRNPNSIRPYQHVLEPVFAYLMIAQKQIENKQLASTYNVGPLDSDCVTTGELVNLFCKAWGNNLTWQNQSNGGPHEANFLKLDISKIKNSLNWSPCWSIEQAVQKTIDWTKVFRDQGDLSEFMDQQIVEYNLVFNRKHDCL